MPVKIQNLSSRPVLLRLNSGQTLHLDPRTTSPEITDVEVERNAKVKKLEERRVITLLPIEKKKGTSTTPKKGRAKSTKDKK